MGRHVPSPPGGGGGGNERVAHVKASRGIGCGLIIDGKRLRSYNETAGEIENVVVDESGLISVDTLAGVMGDRGGARER